MAQNLPLLSVYKIDILIILLHIFVFLVLFLVFFFRGGEGRGTFNQCSRDPVTRDWGLALLNLLSAGPKVSESRKLLI